MIDTKKFILLIIVLIFHSRIFGQSDSLEIPVDEQLENILEESIQDADDTQINEIIEELITNPVELNNASIDDLLRIPYIDLELANQIIQFRNKYGYYLTTGELINVSGMSPELLNKIRPFIFID
ncbi:MAG: ComEA family DNA-binding protein, partial [Ignavibacteria bacterium]